MSWQVHLLSKWATIKHNSFSIPFLDSDLQFSPLLPCKQSWTELSFPHMCLLQLLGNSLCMLISALGLKFYSWLQLYNQLTIYYCEKRPYDVGKINLQILLSSFSGPILNLSSLAAVLVLAFPSHQPLCTCKQITKQTPLAPCSFRESMQNCPS